MAGKKELLGKGVKKIVSSIQKNQKEKVAAGRKLTQGLRKKSEDELKALKKNPALSKDQRNRVEERLKAIKEGEGRPVKNKVFEQEGSRKDSKTKGSVNVARSIDSSVSQGTTKVTQDADKKGGFIQEQTTKADRTRGKTKAKLSAMARNTSLSPAQRKKAEDAYNKKIAADKEATTRRNIKISQAARKNKKVSLAETSAERKAKKPADVPKEFFDEATGEVYGISTAKWNSLTPRQKNQMLENFKARARTGEDLSDKAMAKRNLGRAAAGLYEGRTRAKAPAGVRGEELKRGGRVSKSKPRGVGCATRGYGKALMGGGKVKGKY